MAAYRKQEKIAEADFPSQPARASKIRGIRREFYDRRDTQLTGITYPSESDHLTRIKNGFLPVLPKEKQLGELHRYGRRKANDMLTFSLPNVVAYDPETDPGWPY